MALANRVERVRKTLSLAGETLRQPLRSIRGVGGAGWALGQMRACPWLVEDARETLGIAQVGCRGRGP